MEAGSSFSLADKGGEAPASEAIALMNAAFARSGCAMTIGAHDSSETSELAAIWRRSIT